MSGTEAARSSRYDYALDPLGETSGAKLVRLAGHGRRVLDLGCATGVLARALVEKSCTVVGVEIDAEAAKIAEMVCEHVVVGDLEQIDLQDAVAGERFDVVIAGDVLEHLRDPAAVLRQIPGVLNPGGRLLISVPNIAHASVRLALLHGGLPYADTGLLDRTHRQFWNREQFLALLAETGWKTVWIDTTNCALRDSEVPFPEDELTAAVEEEVVESPDALVYQFVVVAVPDGAAQDSMLELVLTTAEEFGRLRAQFDDRETHWRRTEQHVTNIEARAEQAVQEAAREVESARNEAAAKQEALYVELLAARDEIAKLQHEFARAQELYRNQGVALAASEGDRRILHERARVAEAALDEIYASRLWRVGTAYRSLLARLRGAGEEGGSA